MPRSRCTSTELNVQGQPKFVWPATFVLARAYVDQLARNNGLSAEQDHHDPPGTRRCGEGIRRAAPDALTQLATQVDGDAAGAADAAKVAKLADAVRQLSSAPMASTNTPTNAAGN